MENDISALKGITIFLIYLFFWATLVLGFYWIDFGPFLFMGIGTLLTLFMGLLGGRVFLAIFEGKKIGYKHKILEKLNNILYLNKIGNIELYITNKVSGNIFYLSSFTGKKFLLISSDMLNLNKDILDKLLNESVNMFKKELVIIEFLSCFHYFVFYYPTFFLIKNLKLVFFGRVLQFYLIPMKVLLDKSLVNDSIGPELISHNCNSLDNKLPQQKFVFIDIFSKYCGVIKEKNTNLFSILNN